MVGGLKWAVTAEFRILKPLLHCCDIFSVMHFNRTRVDAGCYPGYPWEHLPSAGRFPWDRQWLDGQYIGGRLISGDEAVR